MKITFLKESKYRDIFLSSVKNLAILLFFGAALFFISRNIEKTTSELADSKKKIAENVCLLETYSMLLPQKKLLEPQIKELNQLLPKEEGLLSLKNDLAIEADRFKIALSFNFLEKEPVKDDLSAIKISINLSAPSLNQISLFLERLKKLPFYLSIDQFTLERLNFSGSGRIFIRKE